MIKIHFDDKFNNMENQPSENELEKLSCRSRKNINCRAIDYSLHHDLIEAEKRGIKEVTVIDPEGLYCWVIEGKPSTVYKKLFPPKSKKRKRRKTIFFARLREDALGDNKPVCLFRKIPRVARDDLISSSFHDQNWEDVIEGIKEAFNEGYVYSEIDEDLDSFLLFMKDNLPPCIKHETQEDIIEAAQQWYDGK